MFDTIWHIILEIWLVTAQMAPYLLLGFFVAGLLSVYISPAWLERHLGGKGLGPVWKASLFGVPLPLCSCGVIPVAASLRAHGASRSATTAFLLSTPQTGVDSIAVTFTMLGPLFAVFRPVAALLTGFLGGTLVQGFDPESRAAELEVRNGLQADLPPRPKGLRDKWRAVWGYGFLTLPADIGRALLIGVVIAGALSALMPEDYLARYLGTGPASIALMMIVGIPIYVCATASVPLAASFIFMGATPGAALAFLIAGPATNAATLTTIARVLGRKTTLIYLLTVAGSAFGGGLLLDWLMPRAAEALPALSGQGHHHEGVTWFDHLSALALIAVMTWSWFRARQRGGGCGCEHEGEGTCGMDEDKDRLELDVTGMNCSHCSGSVERTVGGMEGIEAVNVSLDVGRATITGEALDADAIIDAINALGFKASRR